MPWDAFATVEFGLPFGKVSFDLLDELVLSGAEHRNVLFRGSTPRAIRALAAGGPSRTTEDPVVYHVILSTRPGKAFDIEQAKLAVGSSIAGRRSSPILPAVAARDARELERRAAGIAERVERSRAQPELVLDRLAETLGLEWRRRRARGAVGAGRALDVLGDQGAVRESPTHDNARVALVRSWAEATGAGKSALLLASRNDDVRAMNELAREAVRERIGEARVYTSDFGERSFGSEMRSLVVSARTAGSMAISTHSPSIAMIGGSSWCACVTRSTWCGICTSTARLTTAMRRPRIGRRRGPWMPFSRWHRRPRRAGVVCRRYACARRRDYRLRQGRRARFWRSTCPSAAGAGGDTRA